MRNAVVQLVLVVVATGVASRFGFDLTRAGSPAFLTWMAVPTVALALYGAFVAYKNHDLVEWVRPRAGDFTRGFVGAAVLFFGAWVFTHSVMPQGSARESWLARLYLQLGHPDVLRKNVSFIVVAIIVMAIAEELVWRGLVLHLLEKVVGWRRAWIVGAVLYTLAHLPTAWALRDPVAGLNPIIPLGALACGLVWGGMAHRYDRLVPGIVSHALFDWTVVMMFRLWGPSV